MAREVTHEANGPYIVDDEEIEERGTIAICECGLSADKPFCDGSHGGTADEEDDVTYKYEDDDDENPRHEVEDIVFAED